MKNITPMPIPCLSSTIVYGINLIITSATTKFWFMFFEDSPPEKKEEARNNFKKFCMLP